MSKMRKLFPTMHDMHVWDFVRLGVRYQMQRAGIRTIPIVLKKKDPERCTAQSPIVTR